MISFIFSILYTLKEKKIKMDPTFNVKYFEKSMYSPKYYLPKYLNTLNLGTGKLNYSPK